MKKILSLLFALLVTTSISFAQAGSEYKEGTIKTVNKNGSQGTLANVDGGESVFIIAEHNGSRARVERGEVVKYREMAPKSPQSGRLVVVEVAPANWCWICKYGKPGLCIYYISVPCDGPKPAND